MYNVFQKDGFDYFTDMMPALHNYVTVDTKVPYLIVKKLWHNMECGGRNFSANKLCYYNYLIRNIRKFRQKTYILKKRERLLK
jgi:hypothetical protein